MAEIIFDRVTKEYADGSTPCTRSISRSRMASSWCWSALPAAASRRRSGWSPGSRTSPTGRILIGGEVANDLSPRERNIAMVFQSYALYPHLTVAENIGFGLRVRGRREGGDRRQGRRDGRHAGARRAARAQAGAALRRPAPARRHGARDGARAAGLPHGRAALQPRRAAARPDARRDRAHPAR